MRLLWDDMLFFLLPFFVFAIVLILNKRKVFERQNWKGPMPWLIVAGLTLSILSIIVSNALTERSTKGYIPPHLENGKLVPGRFE
jgi:hypothetical protein